LEESDQWSFLAVFAVLLLSKAQTVLTLPSLPLFPALEADELFRPPRKVPATSQIAV
jgi:hypothetical protein